MKASFAKFPKLTSGNDCGGADITVDGVVIGQVCRVIDWKDVGSISVSYRAKITGYRVMFWAFEEEPEFKTLGEARAYARDNAEKAHTDFIAQKVG